ncbi:MAG: LysM peptidoglycan-binding domain-containing M23 family metallopeptidase, partial [Anaerolineales bacterium]
MNRRIPYKPGKREREAQGRGEPSGGGPGSCLVRVIWLLVPVVALVVVWLVRSQSAASALPTAGPSATALIATVTGIVPSAVPSETPAPPPTDPPLPTSTLLPPPSPSPTALRTPAPTQFYTSQSGDTIAALSARFGVNPADIVAPQGLRGVTTLASGQLLVIPRVLGEVGPGKKLIPDSELVFSGAAAGFEPQKFAAEQGGYLAHYSGYANGGSSAGGDVVLAEAQNHSINPRLLIALLEYSSGWVTDAHPSGEALKYPYGYIHPYLLNLNAQLTWATSRLAIGYYGWRDGSLTELTFPDGSKLRLDPTLNAGTVALQYFLSQNLNRPAWDEAVGPTGFAATYQAFFGDPFARALDPLVPPDLTQLPLQLPFMPGSTWYLTGGPHGAWELGGAQAALDFAPGAVETGCAESNAWVTAVAAGLVLRASQGVVVLDLDGDGRETTGWDITYLHLAARGRVAEGAFVERGQAIGHPSCEGGRATGTHVHIARKYNGEWIPAYGPVPFDLSGWVAGPGKGEYYGTLSKNGV